MQSIIIKQLINDFFEQIEEKADKRNKNAKATYWVEELQEVDYNDQNYLSIKKATRLYEKYVENKNNISVREPNKFLCDFMAVYAGYKNFEGYSLNKKIIPKKVSAIKTLNFKKYSPRKMKYFYGLLILPILVLFYNLGKNNDSDCIVWNDDVFIESSCNSIHSLNNSIYNINIENFKKIEITDETIFFVQGKPNVWYGKSKNGGYDYFSARGIHPETLKELKPVTKYIIKKYLKKKLEENQ